MWSTGIEKKTPEDSGDLFRPEHFMIITIGIHVRTKVRSVICYSYSFMYKKRTRNTSLILMNIKLVFRNSWVLIVGKGLLVK